MTFKFVSISNKIRRTKFTTTFKISECVGKVFIVPHLLYFKFAAKSSKQFTRHFKGTNNLVALRKSEY